MQIPQILRPLAHREDPITVKQEVWKKPGRGLYDMHYPVELGIVLSGRMRRTVEGKDFVVESGQIWLQGIWEAHRTEVVATPLELIVVHVLPESLRELSFSETPGVHWLSLWGQPPSKRVGVPIEEAARVAACFKNLTLEKGDALPQKLLRRAHLLTILTFLGAQLEIGDANPVSKSVLMPALDALFESRGRVDLAGAARECGASVSTFKRIFKRQMQTSYASFALRYRIHGVCQELLRTNQPVKRVAHNWGFVDTSHLHRHFKAIMRCTPREYRSAAMATPVVGGLACG